MFPPRPTLRIRRLLACLTVSFIAFPAHPISGADPGEPEELKQQADRWIELEKRVADEQSQWKSEKEILTASIEVLKKEQETLKSKEAANALAASLFQTRLDQTQTELAEHDVAQGDVAGRCRALETRIRLLLPRLPDPLKEKVSPLLQKLETPTTGEPMGVAERTQTLVSVLSSIDGFNNTFTLTHHLRSNGGGETVDVKVLYWGLAMAYAIDAAGNHAWLVSPGPTGWEWHEQPASVGQIRTLMEVHEKKKSPVLVEAPAPTKGGAR